MSFLEEETLVEKNNEQELATGVNKTRVITGSTKPSNEHSPQGSLATQTGQPWVLNGEVINQQSYFNQASLLVLAGIPLISFVITVNRLSKPENIDIFKVGLKQDLFKLRQYLEDDQMSDDMVNKVCFLYAVVVDEAIIHCPWGETIGWENHPLVVELFGYCNGGELFFDIVDEVLANADKNFQLIELVHLFLKLGYRGQYRNTSGIKINELITQCEEACAPFHQDQPLIGCSNIRPLSHKRIKHHHYYKSLFALALLSCCTLLFTLHYQHEQLAKQQVIAIDQQLLKATTLQGKSKTAQFDGDSVELPVYKGNNNGQ